MWWRRGTWTPKEAARLLGEVDPKPINNGMTPERAPLSEHILDLMLSFPECRVERTPAEWLDWAQQHGLYIPEALEQLRQHPANPQAAPAQTAVTVPTPVVEVPAIKPRAKRRTLWDVVTPYIVEIMQAGQYASAKQLFNALEAKAGQGSPFDKGIGNSRGSLFVREISQSLAMKTLQTNWPKLKAAAKK